MRVHKQLNRHRPKEGIIGDCHRTCIAMLLDMKPDEVPNFAEVGFDFDYDHGNNSVEFSEAVREWLQGEGYCEFSIAFNCSLGEVQDFMKVINPDVYYILGGESKSGVNHSVIGLNDEIVADPSISNSGIVGPCKPDGMFRITVLIPSSQKKQS